MIVRRFQLDERGASIVEFGITAPVFFTMVFALIEGALVLWTQLGLQHGVELAARCASINTTICSNATAIQNYASQHSFGVNVQSSQFTVSTAACGNQVHAVYSYHFLTKFFSVATWALTAQACFPKH
jgi:Flp pilus assembly protein TadG